MSIYLPNNRAPVHEDNQDASITKSSIPPPSIKTLIRIEKAFTTYLSKHGYTLNVREYIDISVLVSDLRQHIHEEQVRAARADPAQRHTAFNVMKGARYEGDIAAYLDRFRCLNQIVQLSGFVMRVYFENTLPEKIWDLIYGWDLGDLGYQEGKENDEMFLGAVLRAGRVYEAIMASRARRKEAKKARRRALRKERTRRRTVYGRPRDGRTPKN